MTKPAPKKPKAGPAPAITATCTTYSRMTPEQRRDRAMGRFARGEINLAEALQLSMATGLPVAKQLQDAFVSAIINYEFGEVDDLALPLLGRKTTRKDVRAMERNIFRSKVLDEVFGYQNEGYGMSDPTYHEGTAFERAAEDLGLSPSTVYDIYRGRR